MFRNMASTFSKLAAIGIITAGMLAVEVNVVGASVPEQESTSSTQLSEPIQGQVITKSEVDVTGDGRKDQVSLIGTKLDPSSPYYSKLSIVVSGEGQQQIVIPIEGGYNPQLQFVDFTGDKLPEIYLSTETGGSGGYTNVYIYSLKNNIPVALPIPAPLHITAQFKPNYIVNMTIEETGKTFPINIKDKKDEYDKAGVYNKGKVVKPITVTVNTYSELKPVDIDQNGVYELQGVQRITGLYNADTLANAYSLWKWQQDGWKLVTADIKK
ncbi:hypothetical protein D3C73_622740 [compost metagenome]